MNIDAQIEAIKAKKHSAQIAAARNEAAKDSAQQALSANLLALKKEFDLDNLADARVKLAELRATLNEKLEEITDILDSIDL